MASAHAGATTLFAVPFPTQCRIAGGAAGTVELDGLIRGLDRVTGAGQVSVAKKSSRGPMIGAILSVSCLLGIAVVLQGAENDPGPAEPTLVSPQEDRFDAVGNGWHFGEYGIAELVDDEWISQVADATGIPSRVLRAYAGAEIAFTQSGGGCQVDWSTLAGLGFVESRHGTLHGGHIDAHGYQTPHMFGIPLDGSRSAAVPDTDGGVIDGDDEWDRAMGPMQFIPGTWAYLGADGNRDGESDPQQIDDAVLAAARHLCHGGTLADDAEWVDAVWSYNRSLDYNNQVADAADRYREAAQRIG